MQATMQKHNNAKFHEHLLIKHGIDRFLFDEMIWDDMRWDAVMKIIEENCVKNVDMDLARFAKHSTKQNHSTI